MDQEDEEKLEVWLEEEVIPKSNFIGAKLKQNYTPEKAERLLPALLQLSVTPQYYYEKEVRRDRNELLAKLKDRLKSPENKKKFTSFVHEKDIPYKTGAKPLDVARSMNTELLHEAINYLEDE